MEGKSVVEVSGSVFEDPEPRFDKRPISPRFTLVVAVQELKRSVVPRAAVGPYQRVTAAPFENISQKQ